MTKSAKMPAASASLQHPNTQPQKTPRLVPRKNSHTNILSSEFEIEKSTFPTRNTEAELQEWREFSRLASQNTASELIDFIPNLAHKFAYCVFVPIRIEDLDAKNIP